MACSSTRHSLPLRRFQGGLSHQRRIRSTPRDNIMATASSSKVLISFDVDGTLIHTVGKDANKVAEFGWLKIRCSNFHNALLHKDGNAACAGAPCFSSVSQQRCEGPFHAIMGCLESCSRGTLCCWRQQADPMIVACLRSCTSLPSKRHGEHVSRSTPRWMSSSTM